MFDKNNDLQQNFDEIKTDIYNNQNAGNVYIKDNNQNERNNYDQGYNQNMRNNYNQGYNQNMRDN